MLLPHLIALQIIISWFCASHHFVVKSQNWTKIVAIFCVFEYSFGNSGHLYSHMKGQNWSHQLLMYHNWNIPEWVNWPQKVWCCFTEMVLYKLGFNILQPSSIMCNCKPKILDIKSYSVLRKSEKRDVLSRNPHPVRFFSTYHVLTLDATILVT